LFTGARTTFEATVETTICPCFGITEDYTGPHSLIGFMTTMMATDGIEGMPATNGASLLSWYNGEYI
jgi:hypothetical protein